MSVYYQDHNFNGHCYTSPVLIVHVLLVYDFTLFRDAVMRLRFNTMP